MIRKILQSKWFTAGIGLVITLLVFSLLRLYPMLTGLRKESNNLGQKIDEVGSSIVETGKLRQSLKNPAFLERQARLKLNYKKPDEKVVFVYKDPYNATVVSSSQTGLASGQSLNIWGKFWNWLAGK